MAADVPRIYVDLPTNYMAGTNGSQISLATGTYIRQSGSQSELANDDSGTVAEVSAIQATAFEFNYKITRNDLYRGGTITVASSATGPVWTDEYVQNADTGITLSVSQGGDTVSVTYTATDTGINGTIKYSINYLA